MNDEELDFWGQVGRATTGQSRPWGVWPVGDIIQIWNVLGAVVDRLDLRIEPVKGPPLEIEKEWERMANLRAEIEDLKKR